MGTTRATTPAASPLPFKAILPWFWVHDQEQQAHCATAREMQRESSHMHAYLSKGGSHGWAGYCRYCWQYIWHGLYC